MQVRPRTPDSALYRRSLKAGFVPLCASEARRSPAEDLCLMAAKCQIIKEALRGDESGSRRGSREDG